MKIILNGQAGTNAHAITKKLAERLSLDCITATSFFPQRCFNDRGNLLPEFRLHNDEEVDKMVDAKLKEELAKHPNNFILNSYNGLFLVPDALRILLVIDVQSKPSLAAIDGVRRADLDMAYKGAYIESNYDIVINTFGCSNEEVVDCIMQALESGKYGKYVPLNILLPTNVTDLKPWNNLSTPIRLYVYKGCKFIKPQHMRKALGYARKGIKLVPVVENPVYNFATLSRDEYLQWFKLINTDPSDALKYLSFALYCANFGFHDEVRVFCDLCDYGNPYKQIEAEGITID